MSIIDPKTLIYEGCDLEAMSSAENYYEWLGDIMKPYLGDHIVEVGAGSGSFSKKLLNLRPKKATFVEPTKNMSIKLRQTINQNRSSETKTVVHNAYMSDIKDKVKSPDSFVYINVFEHIEDDSAELKMLKNTLNKGGHIIIYVPALPGLMSEFDESIGHFRRYTKKSLGDLAKKTGLEIVELRYMDILGILPWWGSFVLMRRKKINPKLIGIYDKFWVPVARLIEDSIPMPVGKNVLLVARKK